MTSPSKARMVPADQPEPTGVSGREALRNMEDAAERLRAWFAKHDAGVAADTTLGIAHRLDTDDPRVGEQLVQFEDEWRKEAHAARPAAASAPATPAVGAGTSGGATGAQIGVHEPGLGDAIRAMVNRSPHASPGPDMQRDWADRADALERERDQWRESAEFAAERLDHVQAVAALDTTPLLTATQLRHALDGAS